MYISPFIDQIQAELIRDPQTLLILFGIRKNFLSIGIKL